MTSRIPWPTVTDPNVHREEEWTLARAASRQKQAQSANGQASGPHDDVQAEALKSNSSTAPQRRRMVFADPVAFRYLEEDPSTVVLQRREQLRGYELYLVEQWACSRVHPTFMIITYTGDQSHSIVVGVLGVPIDEESWSPRLRVYFKAVSQYHARPMDTPLGTLMVTNLSGFPSALTVIPVPDGDPRKHREDFIVNENLKRLGCSGRAGLSLSQPAAATKAKFHQLYRTSENNSLYGAVIELVKLCQVALMVFGKLAQEYADGLLCDITEKATNDWWTEIGSEFYNTEPSDGILGPTTVAALLGLLMGARNRLNSYGAPVAKDTFDIVSLKRGIVYFQKSQKIERTRRLDRHTLNRLHTVTAKAAAGEGWAVPKAVKSTVAELSGKGGEMVMGIVGGGKEKAAIGDIETLDIDHFVSLVHGDRAKWLWHGKTRRGNGAEIFGRSLPEAGNMIFGKDDQGGYVWSNKRQDTFERDTDSDSRKKDQVLVQPQSSAASLMESPGERDPHLRKAVLKSVADRMSDARSGFGRIKDAVDPRRRGHSSRPSKDDIYDSEVYLSPEGSASNQLSITGPSQPGVNKVFTWKNKPEEYVNGQPRFRDSGGAVAGTARSSASPQHASLNNLSSSLSADSRPATAQKQNAVDAEAWAAQVRDIRQNLVVNAPSAAGSVSDQDLEGPTLEAERNPHSSAALLHRRRSISGGALPPTYSRNDSCWPRHMSFSEVEEAVLEWTEIGAVTDATNDDGFRMYRKELLRQNDHVHLYTKLSSFQLGESLWVERKVTDLEALDSQAIQDEEEFQRIYYQLGEAYQAVKQSSQDILSEERSHVTEAIKDIEVLGAKLEYEINALVSKVEDVEDGVDTFETHVNDLEAKASGLEEQLRREGWVHWLVRKCTGMGTHPYIEGGSLK